MITLKTRVRIIDNSGAKWGRCIFVLHKKPGNVGDLFLLHITKIKTKQTKIKRGDLFYAIIVKTKKPVITTFGLCIKFEETAAVLLKKDKTLFASRIKGTVSSFLRHKGYAKLLLLSERFL